MSDTGAQGDQILKILSGAQSGVEVALSPGEYTLGSGPDDDIHLVDLSLKPSHTRIRVSPGKIELAGGGGSVKTANGLEIDAGDSDWREVEPLDVISTGMVRFALGPPTAQWTSLADTGAIAGGGDTGAEPARKRRKRKKSDTNSRWRQLALPAIGLFLLAGFVVWYSTTRQSGDMDFVSKAKATGIQAVRSALDKFDFGQQIEVREEVDGTIIATGYVRELVQRRAIVKAVDDSGVPVRIRVWVLGIIENDVASLVKEQKIDIDYQLDRSGNLTLSGVVLDKDKVDAFERLVNDQVLGLESVKNEIKTADSLLEDIIALAKLSQIEGTITFRQQDYVVEAFGAMLAENVDRWVGFLQTYSTKYAQHMPLRSFVQLLNEDGSVTTIDPGAQRKGPAIVVGAAASDDDTVLNVDKLRRGRYDLRDVFVGAPKKEPETAANSENGASGPSVTQIGGASGGATLSLASMLEAADKSAGPGAGDKARPKTETASGTTGNAAVNSDAATQSEDKPDIKLSDAASKAIESWREDASSGTNSTLGAAIGNLANQWANSIHGASEDWKVKKVMNDFLPLLQEELLGSDICWENSTLTVSNLAPVLFWLDIVSMTEAVSIANFEPSNQRLILEAAFNPRKTGECVRDARRLQGYSLEAVSQYLKQSRRNKALARIVARGLNEYDLDVSGINLSGRRYLQLSAGKKLPEGSSPTVSSNILHIGELGIILRQVDGLAVKLYNDELSWLIE